jgi:hypothetical protein
LALFTFSFGRWIQFVREKLSEKNVPMKIYGPSAWLVSSALARDGWLEQENQELWPKVNSIAQKNSDLVPLIFGKWNYFHDHGVEQVAKERLRHAVLHTSLMPGPVIINKPLSTAAMTITNAKYDLRSPEGENRYWMHELLYEFYLPFRQHQRYYKRDWVEYVYGQLPKLDEQPRENHEPSKQLDRWLACVASDEEPRELVKGLFRVEREKLVRNTQMLVEDEKKFNGAIKLGKEHEKMRTRKTYRSAARANQVRLTIKKIHDA